MLAKDLPTVPDDSSTNACTTWTSCPAGQYLAGASATQDGTCTPCPSGEWSSGGTVVQCTAHSSPTCDAGEVVIAGTPTADAYCVCDAGYHLDTTNYGSLQTKEGSETLVNTGTTNEQRDPTVAMHDDGSYVVVWESGSSDDSGTTDNDIYGQRYAADGTKEGSEFLVNTHTTNAQKYPSVAALDAGKFVVTWYSWIQDGSGWGVYAQRYAASGTKEGSEFLVHTDWANGQERPSVAHLGSGKFVVVWQEPDGSDNGIYGQRYAADGTKEGSEFQANTYTASQQQYPSVAALDAGKFVVTWQSYDQTFVIKTSGSPSLEVPQAGCQDAGSAVGYTNDPLSTNDWRLPKGCIKRRSNNEVWYNSHTTSGYACGGGNYDNWDCIERGGQYDIYAQRYKADGTKQGSEFQVNTYTSKSQDYSSVAALDAGKFVVVWESYNQDVTIKSSGSPTSDVDSQLDQTACSTAATALGKTYGGTQSWSAYARGCVENGNVYYNTYSSSSYSCGTSGWNCIERAADEGIYGQRYAADGTKDGSEFQVPTHTHDHQNSPSVAGLGAGKFVVAWQSDGQDGSDYGIYAQRYKADGTRDSTEFRVNTEVIGNQKFASVAGGTDGKFVVVWDSNNQVSGSSGRDIYFQRYAYPKEPIAGSMLCAECAAGTVRPAGDLKSTIALTTCEACSTGSEPNAEGDLCVCKDGNSLDVTPAQKGLVTTGQPTATNIVTQTDCENSGYTWQQSVVASKQCTACAAGTHRAGGDSMTGNATTCEACAAETYSSAESASCTAWTTCAAGEYLAGADATQGGTCTPCPAGSFQGSSNKAASCNPCPAGEYAAAGASSCSPCASGTFSTGGAAECLEHYVCSANSTEETAPSSSNDRVCACEAGHSYLEEIKRTRAEERVNTYTSSTQTQASVAALENGKYVVVWQSDGQDGSGNGIYAQRYAADGTKDSTEFRVNTVTAGWQYQPSVTHLGSGKFVVAWNSQNQASGSSSGDIYAQIYEADGSKQGGEFLVNDYTTSTQENPSVAGLGSGKFVVVWHSTDQDGSGNGVYAQRFLASGTKDGSEFQVNTYTTSSQHYASVTALDAGKFVVTWFSYNQDGSGEGIYAQIYAADGTTEGSEFQVNTYTSNSQQVPRVAHLGFGKFVVAWMSRNQDASNSWGIYAQRYAADGTEEGSEFRVNTYTTNNQENPSVAALDAGKFVVAWFSQDQDGSGEGIYAQMYNADGTALLEEFLVNTVTTDNQDYPSVAGLGNDAFVIAYDSPDSDSDGIFKVDFKFERSGCTACAAGTSRAAGDLSSGAVTTCAPCLAGEYAPAAAASCSACVGDTYSTGGAAECTAQSCPTGYEISVDQGTTAADVCEKCSNGYHLDTSNYAVAKQGSETQVNTFTTDHQRNPSVAMHEDGTYVVVWQSSGQEFIFKSSGSPNLVMNEAACQTAANALGRNWNGGGNYWYYPRGCVIDTGSATYYNRDYSNYNCGAGYYGNMNCLETGYDAVYAQRYKADGTKEGSEFKVNTEAINNQRDISVAALDAGKFVVTWMGAQTGSSEIYGQRYAANGNKDGSEFTVNAHTTLYQNNPSVAHVGSGKFVVTWDSYNQASGSSLNDIYVQRYSADGTKDGSEFLVNTETGNNQEYPSVAHLGSGKFVIAWQSWNQDGSSKGIYAQRFKADGTPEYKADGTTPDEFRVNTYTSNDQRYPSVAALEDGKFVVAWESYLQDSSGYGVYAQRFKADGTPEYKADGTTPDEFRVNTHTTSDQKNPSVAGIGSGTFVVAWDSFNQDGSNNGVYAKVYNDGAVVVDEFRVNTLTSDNQDYPSVAGLPNGKFVFAYNSYSQDTFNTYGIYAQRYLSEKQPIAGSMLCTQCEASLIRAGGDLFSDLAVRSCDTCSADSEPNADQGACVCADGHSFDGAQCQACSAGTFRASGDSLVGNTTSCEACPPESYSAAEAASCTPWTRCAAGSYLAGSPDATQDGTCTPCDAGTYQPNADSVALSCDACPAGEHSAANASSCTAWAACAAGEFYTGTKISGEEHCQTHYVCSTNSNETVAPTSTNDRVCACDAGHSFSLAGLHEIQGETVVNTYTSSAQTYPSVAALEDGKYVVVWKSQNQVSGSSDGDIYAQRYAADGTKEGGEFLVNTFTTNWQSFRLESTVAHLGSGKFVVVWGSYNQASGSSDGDIYGQRYAADGTKEGTEFLVNTHTSNSQIWPTVAGLDAGKFVVVWRSTNQDGFSTKSSGSPSLSVDQASCQAAASALGLTWADTVSSAGDPRGCMTHPNNGNVHYNTHSSSTVQCGSSGCINGLCWNCIERGNGDNGIYAQLYAADGTKEGDEFQVNTHTTGNQDYHTVAALDSGKFVVAWTSYQQHSGSSSEDIYAQRYAADGTKDGSEFLVNTHTSSGQWKPCVAHLGSGKFVVVWGSFQQDDVSNWNSGIYAQRYAADGTKEGSEFLVNTYTTGHQADGSIAALDAGKFVVTWASQNQVSGSSDYDVYAQRYKTDGTKDGTEFLVNTHTSNTQGMSSVTGLGANKFVVVWESHDQASASSDDDIYQKLYIDRSTGCDACPIGTSRAGGDLSNAGATTCAPCDAGSYADSVAAVSCTPCSAGSFSDASAATCTPCSAGSFSNASAATCTPCSAGSFSEASAATCTPYTNADCDAGLELVTSAGNAPVLTEDASCSACVEGKWQGLDNTTNLCQTQTDLGCEAATEVGDGTSSVDSAACVCANGHRFNSATVTKTTEVTSQLVPSDTDTSKKTEYPSIAYLTNGNFVIVWTKQVHQSFNTDNKEIYARIFDTNNSPVGNEFLVNSNVDYHDSQETHSDRSVAALSDGKFVVVWKSIHKTYYSYHVYAKVFNADGSVSKSQWEVAGGGWAMVAGLSNGKFVVVYQSGGNVWLKGYNSDHATNFVTGQINTGGTSSSFVTVASLLNGQFVAAWYERENDGVTMDIYYQKYNADGTTSGSNKVAGINDVAYANYQDDYGPSVAGLENGKFVIVWQTMNSQTSYDGAIGQMFDASGNLQGSRFWIASTAVDQVPKVRGLSGSSFIVTWMNGQIVSGSNVYTTRAQYFTSSAVKDGSSFLVNNYRYPAIGASKQGVKDKIVIVANEQYASGVYFNVYSVRYGICSACSAGTFRVKGDSITGATTSCEACPSETYSTGTAVECSPWSLCQAGSYNSAPLATADSVCSVCGANTYTATSNRLTACTPHKTQCPTGEHLKAGSGNTTHDMECEGCPTGTFQASASGSACADWRTTCDKGTQIESDGSASQDHSCSTCASGKFQPLDATADACADYRTSCPPGFALQDDGTAETDRTCQACSNTTFKDDHGNHSCTTFRTTCPAGSQLVQNGNTEKDHDCQLCPQGTYKEASGTEACAVCEAAKEVTPLNSVEGATGCVACVQATHMDSDGLSHTACEALNATCPAGMGYLVTVATKPNLCLPCAAGSFQPNDDSKDACAAHTVSTCPAAQQLKAGTASTDSVCEACPSGTYKAGSGAEACLPWLYEVCALGYERTLAPSATQDGNCSACAAGYFNNGKNAEACKAHRQICPAGYGLQAGTTEADASCVSCASGTFSAALDGGACVAHRSSCAAGEALGTDGDASKDHSCTPCASGTYNTDGTVCVAHTESSCAAGKGFTGSSMVNNVCEDCVDSYQPNAGSTAACKAWTVCDTSTEIESQAPSATQDRACACKEGHRFDKNTGACVACGAGLKRAAGDIKLVLAQ